MKKLLITALVSFSFLGAGCAQERTAVQVPQTAEVEVGGQSASSVVKEMRTEKSFCNTQAASGAQAENKLWVSSENFNGFNHAPTIQHVCRGARELFYLRMDWDDQASPHTGMLIAISSSSTKAVTSTNKDPNFQLLETDAKHPEEVRVSIDGNVVMFSEAQNQFVN
jgi:hypothetical protein